MAYIEVDVEIEDYLDEVESKSLIKELERRGFKVPQKEGEIVKDIYGNVHYNFPEFKSPEQLLGFIKEALGLKSWHDKKRLFSEIDNLY